MKMRYRIPEAITVVTTLAAISGLVGIGASGCRNRAPENELKASGTVEATQAQLGFEIAGKLAEVSVQEGDLVAADQLLARLDTSELAARRQEAAARADAARALLNELESGSRPEEIAQARAGLDAAEARLADAQRDLERSRALFEGKAASREAVEKATAAVAVAGSQREQAAEQLALVERGPRREKIEAQQAQVAQSEAAVAVLDVALVKTALHAPFAAVVAARHREPGEIVAPGAAVLTLTNAADRWVRIYVPENRIGALRLGQGATIRSDTYPEKSYTGELIFISPQAEFTPKTVQTTEERVKLVYAVKIQITGDPQGDLKPGLPADVTLELAAQ